MNSNQIIDWISKNKEWLFSGIAVTITVPLIKGLYGRLIRTPTSKPNQMRQPDRLNGVIDITSNRSRVNPVFYSRRFKSTPYLNLKLMGVAGDLEVLDQRPDGFEFTVSIQSKVRNPLELPPLPSARGPHVVWEAEGQFQVDLPT